MIMSTKFRLIILTVYDNVLVSDVATQCKDTQHY